jgi:hypothetical protein
MKRKTAPNQYGRTYEAMPALCDSRMICQNHIVKSHVSAGEGRSSEFEEQAVEHDLVPQQYSLGLASRIEDWPLFLPRLAVWLCDR